MKYVFMLMVIAASVLANNPKLTNQPSKNEINKKNIESFAYNNVYKYAVSMRTSTIFGQDGKGGAKNLAGVQMNAYLTLQPKSEELIWGQLTEVIYRHAHHMLKTCNTNPMDNSEDDKPEEYKGLEKPFEFRMKDGLVQDINVDNDMSMSEINVLKGLLGTLQYDTTSKNVMDKSNSFFDSDNLNGVYKKMEREISGDCETLYTVAPIYHDVLQQNPEYATFLNIDEYLQNQDQHLVEVRKSKNYGNCDKRVACNSGIPEGANWERSAESSKNFLQRSTVYRLYVDSQNGTIYQVEGIDHIDSKPLMNNDQNVAVISTWNVTLMAIEPPTSAPKYLGPTKNIESLIYGFGNNSKDNDRQINKSKDQENNYNQNINKNNGEDRYRRSGTPTYYENSNKSPQNRRKSSILNKLSSRFSSSSSSSSESSDNWLDLPDEKNEMPSLCDDQSKYDVNFATDDVIEIVNEIQNPNDMVKRNTLSKLSFVAHQMTKLNLNQLKQLEQRLSSYSRGEEARAILIDLVAESGTPAAYYFIKDLIISKKLRREKAAEIIATLARTFKYPTKEIVDDYFSFAFENGVREELFLNTSILLSVTSLINIAHVNNHSVHNYYPTHLYGRFIPKDDQIVTKKFFPVLERELRNAVLTKNSHKAQVLVRAIGNIGHPGIFQVFAPYLQNKIKSSVFLRREMVMNMAKVAKIYPAVSRNILFNIYNNKGDDYKVRVAAIFQLLKSKPTSTMMNQLAEDTHTDPSYQVRSAIQSSIQYASELDPSDEKFVKLSQYAKAALPLLNSESYEYGYSKKIVQYWLSEDVNAGTFRGLAITGSRDSLWYNAMDYTMKNTFGDAWTKPTKMSYAVSSISQLMEMFKNVFQNSTRDDKDEKIQYKFSADNIAKLLNVKGDLPVPLQANAFFKLVNQERVFAFGEDDFQQIEELLQSYFADNQDITVSVNYTKFYEAENTMLSFPTITGMNYLYKSNKPVFFKISGQTQANIQAGDESNYPENINVTSKGKIVFSSNYEGRAGFYCNLAKKFITTGMVDKSQYYLPMDMNFSIDLANSQFNLKMKPLEEKENTQILHKSQQAYTSIIDQDENVVPLRHRNTGIIRTPQPTLSYNQTGQTYVGMAFNFDIESDSEQLKSFPSFDNNPFSYPKLSDNSIYQYSRFSVHYIPEMSSNNVVVYSLSYDKYQNSSANVTSTPWTTIKGVASQPPKDEEVNSQSRRKQLSDVVCEGIEGCVSNVVDMGLQFQGNKPFNCVLTLATAKGVLERKYQTAMFYSQKPSSDYFKLKMYALNSFTMNHSPMLNFDKAVRFAPKAYDELYACFTDDDWKTAPGVLVQTSFGQTEKRRQYLSQVGYSKACEKEMASGNNLMKACELAIYRNNVMDEINVRMTTDNIPNWKTALAVMGHLPLDLNNISTDNSNTLDMRVRMENGMKFASINVFGHPIVERPIGKMFRTVFAINPSVGFLDRVGQRLFGRQYKLACAIDGNKISTFSNKEYAYKIGNCWHVAMMKGSKFIENHQESSQDQVAVLVRNNNNEEKELRIHYRNQRGESLIIEVEKDKQVSVNGIPANVREDHYYTLKKNDDNSSLLEAFYQTSNELILRIDGGVIQLETDGKHVLIKGSDGYRNTSRGLCGAMTFEPLFDQPTPENCYLTQDKHSAASWALADDECDEATIVLSQAARQQVCSARTVHGPTVRARQMTSGSGRASESASSSSSASSESNESAPPPINRSKLHDKTKQGCQVYKSTQVIERNGEICFSVDGVYACNEHCKRRNETFTRALLVCRPNNDPDFQRMRDSIVSSQNQAKLNGLKSNDQITFLAPGSCQE